jgi:hypothetical protein
MNNASTALEPGIVVAGKLRVVRMLGAGGMGAVYEVEHQITKHRRAMKLMHRGMALLVPDAVTRFLREASAAGRIGNPHIVETFDAGELPGGEPYIVMEMLHGRSLADVIAQTGPLDAGLVVDIMLQACDGVQAAHDAGIVHRDLKPDNLFLVEGAAPLLKILDFGVSKFDPDLTGDARVTAEGATLGTPSYMAPEQLGGDGQIDARTDVYALGVVLYECLTANIPYTASSLPELALRIYEGHYTPLSQQRPDLLPEFDAIVARAMARDKTERYATVRELGAVLAALSPAIVRSGVRSVVSPAAFAETRASNDGRPILRARRQRPAWQWLLAALVLALALALALTLGNERKPAGSPNDGSGLQALPAPRPDAGRDQTATDPPKTPTTADPTVVVPAASQPSAAEPRLPAAPQPAAQPEGKHKNRSRTPSASRAREHGLLEDNPF